MIASALQNITRTTSNMTTSFIPSTTLGRITVATMTCIALAGITIKFNAEALLRSGLEKNSALRVKLAIMAGADVNARDNSRRTPLHSAVQSGNEKITNALLAAGADVNARDNSRRTPLHSAVQSGNEKITNALLAAGADVNEPNILRRTPLLYAIILERGEIIYTLLAAGADAKARDNSGKTPLHAAVEIENKKAITALLNAGANINAGDDDKITPLHSTALSGGKMIIETLLNAGAYLNVKDHQGRTPLYWAAEFGNINMVRALIQAGTNPQIQNNDGEIPLAIARSRGHESIVGILQQEYGNTPLHYAAINGSIQEFENAVIAPLNAPNIAGITPLHLAARYGHDTIVSFFFNKGANPFVQDNAGNTALHYSVMARKNEISKLLVKFASTLGEIKNKDGKTPFDLAPLRTKGLKQAHDAGQIVLQNVTQVYLRGNTRLPREMLGNIFQFVGGTDQEMQHNFNTVLLRTAKLAFKNNDSTTFQKLLSDHPTLLDFPDHSGKKLLDHARESPRLYKNLYSVIFKKKISEHKTHMT